MSSPIPVTSSYHPCSSPSPSRLDLNCNFLINPFQSTYNNLLYRNNAPLTEHEQSYPNYYLSTSIQEMSSWFFCSFDTLDHFILLHRLSTWFDLSSHAYQLLTSYLSSHISAVAFPLIFLLLPLYIMASHEAHFLAPIFSISIPKLSALSSALILHHTYFIVMTYNFSSPSFLKCFNCHLFHTVYCSSNFILDFIKLLNSNCTQKPIFFSLTSVGKHPSYLIHVFRCSLCCTTSHTSRIRQKCWLHLWLRPIFIKSDLLPFHSCHYRVHDLRRIPYTITASAIGTSLVHYRFDYCKSPYRSRSVTILNVSNEFKIL